MAATDTFDWFLRTLEQPSPDLRQYLADQRSYLLVLRSEDERQRFVEQVMREVNHMTARKPVGQRL